jgi:hypothetical protein
VVLLPALQPQNTSDEAVKMATGGASAKPARN